MFSIWERRSSSEEPSPTLINFKYILNWTIKLFTFAIFDNLLNQKKLIGFWDTRQACRNLPTRLIQFNTFPRLKWNSLNEFNEFPIIAKFLVSFGALEYKITSHTERRFPFQGHSNYLILGNSPRWQQSFTLNLHSLRRLHL